MFKDFFKRRKERKLKETYNKGYDMAAGALLRGEMTPRQLQGFVDSARTFHAYTVFDAGIEDAIQCLCHDFDSIPDDRVWVY